MFNLRSAGELPLSIDEAYNLKQSRKQKTHAGPSRGKGHDLLYTVMLQCKTAENVDRFVQEVTHQLCQH